MRVRYEGIRERGYEVISSVVKGKREVVTS